MVNSVVLVSFYDFYSLLFNLLFSMFALVLAWLVCCCGVIVLVVVVQLLCFAGLLVGDSVGLCLYFVVVVCVCLL